MLVVNERSYLSFINFVTTTHAYKNFFLNYRCDQTDMWPMYDKGT